MNRVQKVADRRCLGVRGADVRSRANTGEQYRNLFFRDIDRQNQMKYRRIPRLAAEVDFSLLKVKGAD
jgi:hypothetical protein